jgi:1-pyrroline-5-carboxylate dehydrogenase
MKPFANEVYLDFSDPTVAAVQKAAIRDVGTKLGKTYKNYVNGEWITGDKGTFDSLNPGNLSEVIGTFPMLSKEQALGALDAAWTAFDSWKRVPAKERADYLFKAADVIRRRRGEINAWMITEVGKNFIEADAETCEAIDFLDYYARLALKLDEGMDVIDSFGDVDRTVYVPLGAGVSISPWNFPFAITFGMAAGPIVAGNTVVAKPSPDSPMMAYLIAEILEEVGLPKGVFNFVTGDNLEVGESLVMSPRTRFINFTGSLGVGLHITELAAKPDPDRHFIKRVVTELGGKNAVVVDDDADLDAAALCIVQSAFGFQGQKCSAGSRALVVDSVYDTVLEKVVELTKGLSIGESKDNPRITCVINQKAVDKIMSYIDIGKKEARLVLGGERASSKTDGYYIQPTIFADVAPDARIAQEEIFGPVVAFIRAKDTDHALAIANGTRYGLTGAYFSSNPDKIRKAITDFQVGNLYINRKCTGALVGAQPFGGFNLSGTDSKAGGADYLLYFVQAKAIAEKPNSKGKTILETMYK